MSQMPLAAPTDVLIRQDIPYISTPCCGPNETNATELLSFGAAMTGTQTKEGREYSSKACKIACDLECKRTSYAVK